MPPGGSREKVITIAEAREQIRAAQAAGEVVVHCHGCFDIVHPGHIRHLEHAARLGDRLIVSVTADATMGKGESRPLIPQELRAESLAALDCVAWVTVSPYATATPLLGELQADIYVKGREYERNQDPRFEEEKRTVQAYGGRVVLTSGDVIFSSTALVQAMEEQSDPVRAAVGHLFESHDLTVDGLDGMVSDFQGRRVLVVGETIVDTYVLCDQPVVAGEGPMLSLRPLEYRHFDGGAAIIARHLAAMGARPVLLTPLPSGEAADRVVRRLEAEGVELEAIDVHAALVEKQRFLVGTTKVMKLDLGGPIVLDETQQHEAVSRCTAIAAGCDAAIIADFGLGFLTAPLVVDLCHGLRPQVDILAGDVSGQRANLLAMRDLDVLCPSEVEIRGAMHDFDSGLSAVVWSLLQRTKSRSAVVTLGHEGLITFDRRADTPADLWSSRLHAEHIPPLAAHAVDQLGCGDALIAAITLARLGGASLPAAAVIGSVAAAVQAQRLGNAVVGAADLRRGLKRLGASRLTFHPQPAASSSQPGGHDYIPAAHP